MSDKKNSRYDNTREREEKPQRRKTYNAYDSHSVDIPGKIKRKERKKAYEEDSEYKWGKTEEEKPEENVETQTKKQKPTFKQSGLLSKDQRVVEKGVETKFVLPPEGRVPDSKWILYPFKRGEPLDPYYIHRQSHYMFGRDREICHIPTEHPSCSKQHAVIVFRQIVEEDDVSGNKTSSIRPYIMDLGSTNGTFMNDVRIDDMRYYELFDKDSIKFGASTREYILIRDNS